MNLNLLLPLAGAFVGLVDDDFVYKFAQQGRRQPLNAGVSPHNRKEFLHAQKREQLFKVCKNCNRYFAINSYTNTEYCDREYADTGRTCKAIGATQTYKKKIHENPVIGAYNKEHKKRFAWIKYGKIPKDTFYEWSKQAQTMRDRALAGEVTLAEFGDWLRD